MFSLKNVLIFGGGIAVGVWITKQYVKNTIADDIHQGLDSVGLGGGKTEAIVQGVVNVLTSG